MIVGLTGQMGSGKDTVADYLVSQYWFKKVGFADALYDITCTLFDITRGQAERYKVDGIQIYLSDPKEWPRTTKTHPITMRQFLQRLGTDVGRDMFGQFFWVQHLFNQIDAGDTDIDYVIKDVRFDNEANAVTRVGLDSDSVVWRITRPGYEGDGHTSEAGITDKYVAATIENNGTLEDLYYKIDLLMEGVHVGRSRAQSDDSVEAHRIEKD